MGNWLSAIVFVARLYASVVRERLRRSKRPRHCATGRTVANKGESMDAIKNYLSVLFGTKTGRTAFAGMVGLVAGYFNGAVTPDQAVVGIFALIQTVNIRDAVAKSGPVKDATGGGGTN